jgi:hypothetical protein
VSYPTLNVYFCYNLLKKEPWLLTLETNWHNKIQKANLLWILVDSYLDPKHCLEEERGQIGHEEEDGYRGGEVFKRGEIAEERWLLRRKGSS